MNVNRERGLSRFATRVSDKSGSTPAFAGAVTVVPVWLATGPAFHDSNTWQLVINAGTTIISEKELAVLHHHYAHLAERAKQDRRKRTA